jgi:ABC-type multidrug transport system permease subunit
MTIWWHTICIFHPLCWRRCNILLPIGRVHGTWLAPATSCGVNHGIVLSIIYIFLQMCPFPSFFPLARFLVLSNP